MGFRTLDISSAAEIHIKDSQLLITTEEGTACIPIEIVNHELIYA